MTGPVWSAVKPYVRNVLKFGFALGDDLKALPARLTQPGRLGEPFNVVHHVGGGDFRAVGDQLLATLIEHGALTPEDVVLDIGCGTGRVAEPLSRFLSDKGGYIGFDLTPRAIVSCQLRYRKRRPDFRFVCADIQNGLYNTTGAVAEDGYRFPTADGEVSFAFATSVFSHMQGGPIAHYLNETARSLGPGGRFLFTGYVLDEASLAAIAEGRSGLPFHPWRDGAWVQHADHPEGAIAHTAESFRAMIADAGLTVRDFRTGAWRGAADYQGWQDMFVVEKS